MKVLFKRSIVAIGVMAMILVLAFSYGYLQYNKPRRSASGSHTERIIDARTLFHDFQMNETQAGTKYLNKVIEVNGVVADIDSSGGNIAILLSTGTAGFINCAMNSRLDGIRMNNEIRIKGKCAGYMMDVILVDCVVL